MSERTILEHGSPTLAGIKTGNLITCSYKTKQEVQSDLRKWNRILTNRHLRIIPLKYMDGKVLLYIYRPAALRRDLMNPKVQKILRACGYQSFTEADCICRLIGRLAGREAFPHEIGVFIGYPPEDVEGFIRNRGEGYKYADAWKIYGDVDTAIRLIRKYRHCAEVYTRLSRQGKTLEQLAVG